MPVNPIINPLGEYAPYAAFLKQYGLPAVGQNPYQSWLGNQFQPAYAAFQAKSALTPGAATSWDEYLSGGVPTDWRQARQDALATFLGAQEKPAQAQREWQENIGGTSTLSDLMQAALSARYAAPVARRMASQVGSLEQGWLADTSGGQTGTMSFLDYLRQKYGL